jgi:hypothetical protein
MKTSILKFAILSFILTTIVFMPLGTVHSASGTFQPNPVTRLTLGDLPAEAQKAIAASLQRGKLTASDGAASDYLGWSAAISGGGDIIVVGAPLADDTIANQGAAYVFVRSGAGWGTMTQTAKLTNAYGVAYDWFGCSVAISADGSTIVVGAFNASISTNAKEGAAFVYVKPISGWATTSIYTARLASTHRSPQDLLGYSVAVSENGDTIVAGAFKYDSTYADRGAAYVYTRPVSGWAGSDPMYQTGELLSSDAAASDYLGLSVAISGDGNMIVAGAPNVDNGLITDEGAAYMFVKPGGGWTDLTQTAKLLSTGAGTGDLFGTSVSVNANGNTVVVGAPNSSSAKGQAYVFVKPGGGWVDMSQNAKLNASSGAVNDWLGTSVSISGDGKTIVAGAYGADVSAHADQGAAYSFAMPAAGWSGNLTETGKLTASDGAAGDGYGFSISTNNGGQSVVVGAYHDDVSSHADQGSAYEIALMKKVILKSIGSQDGWILESSEFSNIGGTMNSTANVFNLGDNAVRRQYLGILSFNTGSSLPDISVINYVLLRVQKSSVTGAGNPLTLFGGFMVDVKKGFLGTTAGLQIADFQAPAGKTVGPLSPSLLNTWYILNITSAETLINKLAGSGGLTQIRLRFKLDDNNDAIANTLSLFSGNALATSRPQLIIQYYVP